jgi:hypothetical protein
VLLVNSLVPASVPGREDICQSILLAILEGGVTTEELQADNRLVRRFMAAFRAGNMEARGFAVSIDVAQRKRSACGTAGLHAPF